MRQLIPTVFTSINPVPIVAFLVLISSGLRAETDVAAIVEPYEPRTEYFTQREENPKGRQWTTGTQQLPPLADIIAKPAQERPVYGLYMWGGEYAKAHKEVEKLGIKSIRLSGPWKESDEALKMAARNDVEVLYTVANGQRREDRAKWKRPGFESDAAFIADYDEAVVEFIEKYGPDGTLYDGTGLKSPVAVFEVLNEPNYQYMIPDREPREEVEREREALYGPLLMSAYPVIKEAAPSLPVAGFAAGGGGATSADYRFVKSIYEAHPTISMDYDIFTTHPYMHGAPPEGFKVKKWGEISIANNLARMRELLGKYGAPKPVWYTEVGWEISHRDGGQFAPRNKKYDSIVTPDIHAAYTVRLYLWSMRLGVERVFVMHIHDTDNYNGGWMTRNGFEWRPIAHAVKNLTSLMPNPKLLGAQSDGADNTYIYEYTPDHKASSRGKVIVAWNIAGPTEVEVVTGNGTITVYDMVGNEKTLQALDGKVRVQLGPYPIYLVPQG